MKSIPRLLISCASLALMANLAFGSAKPEPVTEAVFFGDSLTDAGTFGFRFTTDSGPTWAQIVARRLGQSDLPNEHVDKYDDVYKGIPGKPGPGGLNYAEGGARVRLPYSAVSQNAEGTPLPASSQVERFLKQHGGFAPNQVAMLYIGTNDIAYNYDPGMDPVLAKTLRGNKSPGEEMYQKEHKRVLAAADDAAQVARRILASGSKHLVVFELADMGNLPWFETKASRDFVSALSADYNRRLKRSLPEDLRITLIRTQDFVQDLLTHREKYGFTHGANEDACAKPEQDYCAGDGLKTADAARTYVFAAGEHMTTRANELLAQYVLKRIGLAQAD